MDPTLAYLGIDYVGLLENTHKKSGLFFLYVKDLMKNILEVILFDNFYA